MNILFLNWRDIKNPSSGGAEILTHELMKGLVKRGHNVTLFTSYFHGSKKQEILNGVRILREGKQDVRTLFSSVHYKAYLFYKNHKGFDLLVDEIHGVPFFTPLYVKGEKVALVCEVAGSLWDFAVKFPFNIFGKIIERIYPFFYHDTLFLTISNSSKKEMQNIGFGKISVLPMGSNTAIISKLSNKTEPNIIFLARVSKAKGAEEALKALKIVEKEISNIRLWIVGPINKNYKNYLLRLINQANLSKNVKIYGEVSEKEKIEILDKAYLLISPSQKEGWGLTIHEAGARGVPSIVYNVPGLCDVVRDGLNGIICKRNTPEELSKNILKLFDDKRSYMKLQMGAIEERKKHTWDKTIEVFLKEVQ